METTIENQPALNPYAAPVLSAPVEAEEVSAKRASLQTLREVNVFYIVAEMSYHDPGSARGHVLDFRLKLA